MNIYKIGSSEDTEPDKWGIQNMSEYIIYMSDEMSKNMSTAIAELHVKLHVSIHTRRNSQMESQSNYYNRCQMERQIHVR